MRTIKGNARITISMINIDSLSNTLTVKISMYRLHLFEEQLLDNETRAKELYMRDGNKGHFSCNECSISLTCM